MSVIWGLLVGHRRGRGVEDLVGLGPQALDGVVDGLALRVAAPARFSLWPPPDVFIGQVIDSALKVGTRIHALGAACCLKCLVRHSSPVGAQLRHPILRQLASLSCAAGLGRLVGVRNPLEPYGLAARDSIVDAFADRQVDMRIPLVAGMQRPRRGKAATARERGGSLSKASREVDLLRRGQAERHGQDQLDGQTCVRALELVGRHPISPSRSMVLLGVRPLGLQRPRGHVDRLDVMAVITLARSRLCGIVAIRPRDVVHMLRGAFVSREILNVEVAEGFHRAAVDTVFGIAWATGPGRNAFPEGKRNVALSTGEARGSPANCLPAKVLLARGVVCMISHADMGVQRRQ
jgi:hypothetical protein